MGTTQRLSCCRDLLEIDPFMVKTHPLMPTNNTLHPFSRFGVERSWCGLSSHVVAILLFHLHCVSVNKKDYQLDAHQQYGSTMNLHIAVGGSGNDSISTSCSYATITGSFWNSIELN